MKKRAPRAREHRASFSPGEVALRHGLGQSYVYDQIRAGRLRATRIGGTGPLRISLEDEARWLEGQPPIDEGQHDGTSAAA